MIYLARAAGSPVAHRTDSRPATVTICGKPAKGMAIWLPSEAGVDRRTWRNCAKCT